MKNILWSILEDNTTKKGRYFDYFIQALIFLSLVSFSLDTLPNLSEEFRQFLDGFEVFSIIIFSIEYLLRVYVSKKPFRYIFSFYGLIDIIDAKCFLKRNTTHGKKVMPFIVNQVYVDIHNKNDHHINNKKK